LRASGHTVLEAASGAEALLISERHGGTIHLLVTDVVMPHMSGRELFERLRSERPEMRTLFMSGHSDEVIAHHGVGGEGLRLLEKPFSREALQAKVREVLDGLATPAAARRESTDSR
ncbi:MAG: response regulator, partial [Planctomycetes bacterium]|nr:response regulator [Planctomycetota bacterium]